MLYTWHPDAPCIYLDEPTVGLGLEFWGKPEKQKWKKSPELYHPTFWVSATLMSENLQKLSRSRNRSKFIEAVSQGYTPILGHHNPHTKPVESLYDQWGVLEAAHSRWKGSSFVPTCNWWHSTWVDVHPDPTRFTWVIVSWDPGNYPLANLEVDLVFHFFRRFSHSKFWFLASRS